MRLTLSTSLKNKTSSLARDPRLVNSVVDSKNRVQKRPSLVASFGPVTIGNGLGLFVRNTPIGPGAPAPELIAITGVTLTTAPGSYVNYNYTLVADTIDIIGAFGLLIPDYGSIIPNTFLGATIRELWTQVPPTPTLTSFVLSGIRVQDFFTSIISNGVTLLSSDATYSSGGSVTTWSWPTLMFDAPGTYSVYIN